MQDYIEILQSIGLTTILRTIGITEYKEKTNRIRFRSPFRVDQKPSMDIYKNTLRVIDWSTDYRHSIFKFVKDLTGQSIISFFQSYFKDRDISLIEKPKKKYKLPEIKLKITGIMRSPYEKKEVIDYCYSRGMSDNFIKIFKVEYFNHIIINDMSMKFRVYIPIKIDNKIISAECRDYTGEQKKALYPPKTSVDTLFNLDKLDRKQPLVLVEGIMDTLKIYNYFTKNVSCSFGINLGERQKKLLNEFEQIVLFIDDDEAGYRFAESLLEFYFKDFQIAIVKNKDPGAATLEETDTALKNIVPANQFILEKKGIIRNTEFNLH